MIPMEVNLCLGAITFHITVDREVELESSLKPFLMQKHNAENSDVSVYIRWQWDESFLPKTEYLGGDSLLKYFFCENGRYVLSVAGPGVYQACAQYTAAFDRRIDCFINEERCHPELMNIGTLMRFLPIRAIFSYFGTLFFHASQVSYKGKGIVFTAPSGTGKTTQAKLWRKYRNAEILCNDRTLIRKQNGKWMTYGYPLDGSEPVRSTKVMPLGCIVLLQQGAVNHVERLRGGKAVASLMSQLVLDAWDSDARLRAVELLSGILEEHPVYLLTCTPESDAVDCLERKLTEDGVIEDGDN